MDSDGFSDPYSLIGCALQEGDLPNFAVPLFKSLETNRTYIQVVGEDDNILAFQPAQIASDFDFHVDVILRVGMEPIVVLAISRTDVRFGNKQKIDEITREMLLNGSLEKIPLFALDVAKRLGEENFIGRLRSVVYNETLLGFPKAQKFFLENDVARETILQYASNQERSDIAKLRINIEGDRINILSGVNKNDFTSEIGTLLIEKIKAITGIDEPQLSFQQLGGSDNKWREDFNSMKYGFPTLSSEIFDCGNKLRFLTYKDAICIIPEMASSYVLQERSSSEAYDDLVHNHGKNIGVSKATTLKAVRLQPVAMRSAQLLRFWILKSKEQATGSTKYRVHLCCLVLPSHCTKIIERLRERQIVDNAFSDYRPAVFTYSMLCLILKEGVIGVDEIQKSFMYATNNLFSRIRFTDAFINRWLEFSLTDFKSYSASDIAGIIGATLPDVRANIALF